MTKKMIVTKKMTKKTTKGAQRKGHRVVRRRALPRGTDLAIVYAGGLDHDRDRAIRDVLGTYSTGSGFSFLDGERDLGATVPDEDLSRIVRALKKIPGIKIKKRVVEWVPV